MAELEAVHLSHDTGSVMVKAPPAPVFENNLLCLAVIAFRVCGLPIVYSGTSACVSRMLQAWGDFVVLVIAMHSVVFFGVIVSLGWDWPSTSIITWIIAGATTLFWSILGLLGLRARLSSGSLAWKFMRKGIYRSWRGPRILAAFMVCYSVVLVGHMMLQYFVDSNQLSVLFVAAYGPIIGLLFHKIFFAGWFIAVGYSIPALAVSSTCALLYSGDVAEFNDWFVGVSKTQAKVSAKEVIDRYSEILSDADNIHWTFQLNVISVVLFWIFQTLSDMAGYTSLWTQLKSANVHPVLQFFSILTELGTLVLLLLPGSFATAALHETKSIVSKAALSFDEPATVTLFFQDDRGWYVGPWMVKTGFILIVFESLLSIFVIIMALLPT